MVCLGNICRSPTAEVVLRDKLRGAGLDGKVIVDSAGMGDWHLDEPMHPEARAELSNHGPIEFHFPLLPTGEHRRGTAPLLHPR